MQASCKGSPCFGLIRYACRALRAAHSLHYPAAWQSPELESAPEALVGALAELSYAWRAAGRHPGPERQPPAALLAGGGGDSHASAYRARCLPLTSSGCC